MQKQKSNEEKLLSVLYLGYFIKCKVIKTWRKKAKKSKKRFYKLRQWRDTQQQYLGRIKVMRDQIKTPLIQSGMISQEQQTTLFPYLDSMIQLGEMMKQDIHQLIVKWDPIHTELAPTVKLLVNGLKIYKDYSNNYEKADKKMAELKLQQKFSEVVKVPFIEDYLIKPVQRPLQYKLFIKDYLHQMPKSHKDYQKVQSALQIVLQVAEQINQSMEESLKSQKMLKLEQIFKNILHPSRKYKTEFYAKNIDVNCKVYVCNDILLLSKELSNHKEEPYMKVPLTYGSYMIRRSAKKYIPETIYVCGQFNSIHLSFSTNFDIESAEQILRQTIDQVCKKHTEKTDRLRDFQARRQTMMMNRYSMNNKDYKWKEQHEYNLNMIISVVGSCQRLFFTGKKTFFFVKFQLFQPYKTHQIIVYELEQFRKIQQYLHYIYKKIQIVPLDTKCKQISHDYVSGDFTKYHQYKSLLIENHLNSVLRCSEVSKKPQFILLRLRLHQALWDYMNRFNHNECYCRICINLPKYTDISFFDKAVKDLQAHKKDFCIINAFNISKTLVQKMTQKQFLQLNLDQKLLWADCKLNKLIYEILPGEIGAGRMIQFDVHMNLGYQIENFPIQQTGQSNVRNVIKQICGIRNFGDGRDLALILLIQNQEYYLNDDESIQQIFKQSTQNTHQDNLLKRISLRSTQLFSSSVDAKTNEQSILSKNKLYLRKLYTFNKITQDSYCEKIYQRYQILLGEILYRFRNQRLFIPFENLKYACSYFYMVQQFNKLTFSNNIYLSEDILRHYMPQNKWNFINEDFIKACEDIIKQQIKQINLITEVYKKIHNLFDKAPGWREYLFPVKSHDQYYGKTGHLMLGVSFQGILIFQSDKCTKLQNFKYSQFKAQFSGNYIQIKTQQTYKFTTNDTMMIQTMMDRYRVMYEYSMSGSVVIQ